MELFDLGDKDGVIDKTEFENFVEAIIDPYHITWMDTDGTHDMKKWQTHATNIAVERLANGVENAHNASPSVIAKKEKADIAAKKRAKERITSGKNYLIGGKVGIYNPATGGNEYIGWRDNQEFDVDAAVANMVPGGTFGDYLGNVFRMSKDGTIRGLHKGESDNVIMKWDAKTEKYTDEEEVWTKEEFLKKFYGISKYNKKR